MASVTKPQTTEKEKVLTCITCRLTFPDPELMRTHYKGELHRFNLKRRVAQLPPVTEAVFKQKMTGTFCFSPHLCPYCQFPESAARHHSLNGRAPL